MNRFSAENISVTLDGQPIMQNASFRVMPGEWWMLVGPNGAGKSTLIQAVSGAISCAGAVRMDAEDLLTLRPEMRARRVAVMEQNLRMMQPYTAEQVIAMGRYAHRRQRGGDPDGQQAIEKALQETGLEAYRDRNVLTLSGGEMQRVLLAQAMCQSPELLMLDEPGNHLDLAVLRQTFDLVDRWRKQNGRAVISVVHDLSLAVKYGTHALLLHEGRQVAAGPIEQVLTRERMASVWQMDVAEWLSELGQTWSQMK